MDVNQRMTRPSGSTSSSNINAAILLPPSLMSPLVLKATVKAGQERLHGSFACQSHVQLPIARSTTQHQKEGRPTNRGQALLREKRADLSKTRKYPPRIEGLDRQILLLNEMISQQTLRRAPTNKGQARHLAGHDCGFFLKIGTLVPLYAWEFRELITQHILRYPV